MKFKGLVKVAVVGTMALSVARCGSSGNDLSAAMGLVAVSSPTTSSSSSSASRHGFRKTFYTAMNGFNAFFGIRNAFSVEETGAPDNLKPLEDMKEDLADMSKPSGDATAAAAEMGNPIEKKSFRVDCYGPSWTDNVGGPSGSGATRPSGDLGIVYKTASDTDTRACAAAKVDALLAGAPSFLNNFIKMQAIMLSAAGKAGKSLPAEEKEEDFKSVMPSIEGITVNTATLARLADDADGKKIYKTVFEFTETSSSKTGSVTIYHNPLNDDNTSYKGIVYATLPHQASMGGAGDKRAMSMVYSVADGVSKMSVKTVANRSSTSTDFFDANQEVDFTKQTSGREDFHWILAEMNETTGEGKFHYAWQAGGGDGASRTFAMYVPAGTAGSLTGTAWAGFGDAIETLSASAVWPEKFFCNWIKDLSNGASIAKVQKQGMSQSNGKFIVDDANNKINFSPKDDCNGDFTVSSASASFLNGARTVTSNDLVAAPDSTAAPLVTPPTFTIPAE